MQIYGTKEIVYIRKEFNSHRIGLVQQHGRNLVPRVLSLPTSRKYPGCGWSRVYVYKSNPHRWWVFDLIVSKLSVEEKVALPHRGYFES